jgi:CelD/BcsL family acetyltransferase involved in cellulose biosynthesis
MNRVGREAELQVEHLDAHGLARLDAAQWDELSEHALVENPFYSRKVMLAALRTIDIETPLEALVVRGHNGELLGLFPYRVRLFPFVTADAACNLYQPSCTPLVRRERAREVVGAWLDAVQSSPNVPFLWRLRHMDLGSELIALLDDALAERGLCRVAANAYQRPRLTRLEGGVASHIQSVVPKRRLKDIERNIRRLEHLGDLLFERAREPGLITARLEQFLELENSGWKGISGSAFLSNEEHSAFARSAFGSRDDGGNIVTIDSLLLDGNPIAVSLNLQVRDTAFTPKCAYDEDYRRYSPGLVLEYLVIKAFYEDEAALEMDAATTREGHVISGLWNGSKDMATLVIGPDDWRPRATAGFLEIVHAAREFGKTAFAATPASGNRKPLPARAWARWLLPIPLALGIAALALE